MSDHIPQEVMANILQRLSVKDLVRCRRVSKPWLAIIDSPQFISSKLQRSLSANSNAALFLQKKKSSLLFAHKNNSLAKYEPSKVLLMGSCHGLICFCIFDSPHDFVVVNPSTGERHAFFSSPTKEETSDMLAAYGFGYDELSDDYKVVRIIRSVSESHRYRYRYRAEICGVRDKGMSRSIPFPGWGRNPEKWIGVFVGGAVHWCTEAIEPPRGMQYDPSGRKYHDDIHSIHLGLNTYHQLRLPDYNFGKIGYDYLNVGIVDNCLSLCANCMDVNRTFIWVMKEYGNFESWSMVYKIDYDRTVPDSVTTVGSNAGLTVLTVDFERIYQFDLMKKESVVTIEPTFNQYPSFEAVFCLESLVKVVPNQVVGGKKKEDCEEQNQKVLGQDKSVYPTNPYFLDLVNHRSQIEEDYNESLSSRDVDFGDYYDD